MDFSTKDRCYLVLSISQIFPPRYKTETETNWFKYSEYNLYASLDQANTGDFIFAVNLTKDASFAPTRLFAKVTPEEEAVIKNSLATTVLFLLSRALCHLSGSTLAPQCSQNDLTTLQQKNIIMIIINIIYIAAFMKEMQHKERHDKEITLIRAELKWK